MMNTSALKQNNQSDDLYSNENQREPESVHSFNETPLGILAERYTYISELGHGTQGHVYKASRKQDGQLVAIKQLKIDSVSNWKSYELFKREGDVLSNLNIEGVAKVYETVEFLEDENPSAFIVQEFVAGENLQVLLNKGHRFSRNLVCEITIRLLNILEKLHGNDPKVIHRDIKPSNIIVDITSEGALRDIHLIDFGAVSNPQIQGGGSTVAGTYGYMAPEQLMGTPCEASDTYAVAALVSYLLSGVAPGDMEVDHFRLKIEPHLVKQPEDMVRVLNQMLEIKIEDRLCHIPEIRGYFEEFKQNKFSITKLFANDYGSKNYDETLTDFQYPGQSTALWLWERLPVKERVLSKAMESAIDVTSKPLVKMDKKKSNLSLILKQKLSPWSDSIFFIFLAMVIGICILSILYGVVSGREFLMLIIGILFVAVLVFVICFSVYFILSSINGNTDLKKNQSNELIKNDDTEKRLQEFKDIFWYGKKIKTKVTNVTLCQLHYNNDELDCYKYSDNNWNNELSHEAVYIKHPLKPLYKIDYRGDNGETGSILTRRNPMKYLHVGDIIPFLEKVTDNDKTCKLMPYPWPLDEITESIYGDDSICLISQSKIKIKKLKQSFNQFAINAKNDNMRARNTAYKSKSR